MNSYEVKTVFRIRNEPYFQRELDVFLYRQETRDGQSTVSIAEPIRLKTLGENDVGQEQSPTLRIRMDEAQGLMDELWQAGVRPTEGNGSAGSMAAVQKHLEDMRTLVFKKETHENKT